jgi:hypothetical protein
VELTKEMQVSKIILETDISTVKAKLESTDLDRSVHGPLIGNIKRTPSDFDDHLLMHVGRSGNEVAHKLAKSGCRNKLCNTWLGSTSDVCMHLLASECAGF